MARSNVDNGSAIEEARNKRLEENKKRFQELGILNLSKSLSEAIKPVQKSPKPKLRMHNAGLDMVEVRRSSRERSSVVSYSEEMYIELPRQHKRLKSSSSSSSWASYLARPAEEVRFASYQERANAMQSATNFQSTLASGNPSFVKSMVRSHVYSCFWLGLPSDFCQRHLSSEEVTMVLEDIDGAEYESIYKGNKRGLSGGWRGFALDKKLDDGDALVFELIEPIRFKIYIFKVCEIHKNKAAKDGDKKVTKSSTKKTAKTNDKKSTKSSEKKAEVKKDLKAVTESDGQTTTQRRSIRRVTFVDPLP